MAETTTMQDTHPGRTGLLVSRLGLGTMNFGDVTDEAAARSILDGGLTSVGAG